MPLMMEHTTPAPSPHEREIVDLFNVAHSDEAFLAGVDLAFVLSKRPSERGINKPSGRCRYALVGWVGRREAHPIQLDVEDPATQRLLGQVRDPVDVVLAKPTLPPLLWDVLNRRVGYFREIPSARVPAEDQWAGWQEETLGDARDWVSRASTRSTQTMALFPRPGFSPVKGRCLVLVDVNYQWVPLSEVGAHGRTGGPQLLAGKAIYFVRKDLKIFRLKPKQPARPEEIRRLWGDEAAARAREDYASITVEVEPVEADG